jgi:putative ATP-binding cassette transporter
VTYFVGRSLIGLNYAQLKKEADYRYKLVNVRDSAESIALYRGEKRELLRVRERLKDVISNMRSIIDWNRNLGFFTHGYNYVLAILPTILVAPLYLRGDIDFGVVIQAGGAFGQVLGALSIIVVNFGGLSSLAAVTNRLGAFWESIERAQVENRKLPKIHTKDSELIQCKEVTLLTPQRDQILVKDLTCSVAPHERLLIVGPSGSGKSSLIRMFAGLWTLGSGQVTRPPIEQSMFIPQRPHMSLGTFRSQFLYGAPTDQVSDEELLQVAEITGLKDTLARVGGWDVEEDWKGLLSLGEQELVAFARIFITKPAVVFLDEATSAVDANRKHILYEELKKKGIRYVSVGILSDLRNYHDVILELQGRGAWRIIRNGESV